MPELPEVETIARSLAPHVVGRRIEAVTVREPRLREVVAPDFAATLVGRRITALTRAGKTLVARLDDGRSWLVHLGMTGRLTLFLTPPPPRAHDHVDVLFDDGRRLVYNDVRRFGRMLVVGPEALGAAVGRGLEPLGDAVRPQVLAVRARGRRVSIKAFLMDQRELLGIGNIYANEILFHAGVRPRRRVGRLRRREWERLVAGIRAVLEEAIACGGSTISDYRDGFERFGSYQQRHRVYDRAGAPCVVCGTPIRSLVIVGRSSYYCPRCQH
ncbi:MAG TPA: bifunctional DNA-formamidopyrimidine glycosylase/DNA-(apurinic or apyrimidinic site) lyase [Candidatus Limnocylindria bacterium]|nr:bifunctional DNA-formamidopyrimidine glycosylase/DNA-(apurinic or apyrimidinic site) lyase [Candidatus Limnocylindria bacterium]